MDRSEFNKLARKGPIMFDGSTGMELSRRGMPSDVCSEIWMIDNADVIIDMQREYVDAGTKVLLTPTLVSSRLKLEKYDLADETTRINVELANITKRAAGDDAFIAVEMGPTGEMIAPMGMVTFEMIYDVYLEQAKALLSTSPDMFVLETFMSLDEIRAAVLAIRSICDLPIIASMTFEGTRTLMGNTAASAAIALVAAGADAVGCNCSSGPSDLAFVIEEMKKVVDVPLFAKPNAGIPQMIHGETVFPLMPKEFAQECKLLLDAGVHFIGGCCGAGPMHVHELNEIAKTYKAVSPTKTPLYICGPRKTVALTLDMPLMIIGERINPTGQSALAADFKNGGYFVALDMAAEQLLGGASVLDVNVSAVSVNQPSMMYSLIENLSTMSPSPLCIDCPDDEAMERGLFRFPGKAILNSITGESKNCEKRMVLAAKYGAVPIILPLNENGLPKTAEDRMNILDDILKVAKKYGIKENKIIVDALIMSIASGDDGMEAVRFVAMCRDRGILTVAGLSNVSFGLPKRALINRTYLPMLAGAGLNMVIANPNDKEIIATVDGINALRGHDEYCMGFVKKYK